MDIRGVLPDVLPIAERDLCVLLSNALENAIHACQPITASGTACTIGVQFHERNGRIFLQVSNPYENSVRFEKGIPVSDRADHGIGVQSICAIVKKYGGVCSFQTENGSFVLRASF